MALFGTELMTTGVNNMMAARRESDARKENFDYNERAAINADRRTRQLYADFQSPAALLQQYKDAGLSPSLMFANGGASGATPATGAEGEGASGVSPNVFGAQAANAALIAKTIAETQQIKAQTKTIEGVANATISSLLADAGFKEAAASAAKAQATSSELDNYVKEQTIGASIYKIRALAEDAGYNAMLTWENVKKTHLAVQFDKETFNERKQIIHNQMEQIAQSISESKSMEKLNDQQRKYFRDLILKNIAETSLMASEFELTTEKFDTFINEQIPILKQELEVKMKGLNIEEKRLVIDAVVESFKGLCIGAATASTLGKGGNLTPPAPKAGKNLGNVPSKQQGAPIYKTTNVWQF